MYENRMGGCTQAKGLDIPTPALPSGLLPAQSPFFGPWERGLETGMAAEHESGTEETPE